MGGHEEFNPSLAAVSVKQCLDGLTMCSSLCLWCSKPLKSSLSVFMADVDQAFEACTGASVSKAWEVVAEQFRTKFNTTAVQVKRGKACVTRIGSAGWTRGWWILNLDQLGAALSAASSGTWASLGDVIVELDGMCIGGPLSSAAVATRVFQEELEAKVPSTQLQWKRYIDDLLAVSRCICATCLEKFFKSLFSGLLSKVDNSDEASQPSYE